MEIMREAVGAARLAKLSRARNLPIGVAGKAERAAASLKRGQEHAAELARIVAAWSELPAVLKGRCWRLWTRPARRVDGEVGCLIKR